MKIEGKLKEAFRWYWDNNTGGFRISKEEKEADRHNGNELSGLRIQKERPSELAS